MRKVVMALFIAILILFNGCSNLNDIKNNNDNTASTSIKTINFHADYPLPNSLDNLVNVQSANVFLGVVGKKLAAERVNLQETSNTKISDGYRNFTPVRVKVIKIFKGSLKEDTEINISLNGGVAGGVNEVYESEYGLEEGKTYLLFVTGTDTSKKHCYRLAVPYYPNPQLVDGKLIDEAENAFHLPNGLNIKQIAEEISGVLISQIK